MSNALASMRRRIALAMARGARAHSPRMETLEERTLLSLLGVNPVAPEIAYNSTGVITYTASAETFVVTATPLSFLPSAGPPKTVTASPTVPAALSLSLSVDNAGNLVNGGVGSSFQVTGNIDLDGDGNPDYTGTLLTGTVTRFGYDNTDPSAVGTDNFDFQLTATGGSLLPLYVGSDIGITMASEHSNFSNFTANFGGGAKGTIGAVPQIVSVPPDILVTKAGPVIANAGDNLTYTYSVTTGNSSDPLSNVTVVDDKAGAAIYVSGDTNNDGVLESNETWQFTATALSPAFTPNSPLINTATATGTFGPGQVQDTATYQLNPYTLNKSLYLFWGGCGGSKAYTHTDNTLFDVQVTKDGNPLGTVTVSQAHPAQLWLANGSYAFQEAAPLPDGYIMVNGTTSLVTGQGTYSGTLKNVITYDLAVDKTGPATANVGDKITYTYTVTNEGPAAVTPVLSDDKAGTPTYQSGDTNKDGLIEEGETWIFTAQYTVPGTTSGTSGCGSYSGGYGGCQTFCCSQQPSCNPTSITNTVTVKAAEEPRSMTNVIGGDSDLTNNTDTWTVQIGKATVTLGSLSGKVYLDQNNNGQVDSRDQGLSCVQVILTGTDDQGQSVRKTTYTDCSGNYSFASLRPGVYSISHVQPKGFIEGIDSVGSLGGSLINSAFANIVLKSGGKGVNYNFAERVGKSGCGGQNWNFCGWDSDDWNNWDWNCDHNWSFSNNWGSCGSWNYSQCGCC